MEACPRRGGPLATTKKPANVLSFRRGRSSEQAILGSDVRRDAGLDGMIASSNRSHSSQCFLMVECFLVVPVVQPKTVAVTERTAAGLRSLQAKANTAPRLR